MLWAALLLVLTQTVQHSVQVKIDTDEAESVLAILDARQADRAADELWQRLFDTEGYQCLKRREASRDRAFNDQEFKEFVRSSELLDRREALRATLADWSHVDAQASAAKALRYLPRGTAIRATIYPMIKPLSNSFVFELDSDPTIFFYMDPGQSGDVFENTLAHELHHVGLAAACTSSDEAEVRDEKAAEVRRWIGAFGEGLAMLAAAGGPDVHPHAASPPEERERWDRDVKRFAADLKRVERFFLDILDGKLATEEERLKVARSFFGVQGPWYTVGWKVAATIEGAFGRERLISVMCDPLAFLVVYNEAATEGDARWDPTLLKRLEKE